MTLWKIIPKSSFSQNILTYVVFNLCTLAAVLAFVYFSTVEVIENEVAEVVETEIRSLADVYKSGGLSELRIALIRRIEAADGDAIYLLSAPNNQRIVGNLSQWPRGIETDGEWTLVQLFRTDIDTTVLVGARAYNLGLGAKLLVGRDMRARRDFQDTLTEAMIGATILTIILTLLGGIIFSRLVLRRLRIIDATAKSIMSGDISRRIPITEKGDEFDHLATTLNSMLSKVEDLINELRVTTESMAHDLRSPLTRLRTSLEQSLLDIDKGAPSKLGIEKAIFETDRILKNVNSLLSLARLEIGLSDEQMNDVNVHDLMEDVCDLYAPLVEEQGMSLEQSFYVNEDDKIKINAQLVIQAIANLIENAIKYAGKKAVIRVSAIKEGNTVIISVADNGLGIPENERVRVTQRFARLSAERKEEGMGLGLYLVATIAKIHNAQMELDDNDPGLVVRLIFSQDI